MIVNFRDIDIGYGFKIHKKGSGFFITVEEEGTDLKIVRQIDRCLSKCLIAALEEVIFFQTEIDKKDNS